MGWLVLQTLVVFLPILALLYGFNFHERSEHPEAAREENEEFMVVLGLASLGLPIGLGFAWFASRQLLKPVGRIATAAEAIREGNLQQRVEPEIADDELGRLAGTINRAFDRYQDALQRMDRFSADAAHQLRNPLASVRAAAEVGLQQARTPEEYQETLGRILEDSARLAHTVEQLLTLARLGRTRSAAEFEQVDVTAVAAVLAENLAPVFEAGDIRFRLETPPGPVFVSGIAGLLEQAVANILDNAARFTPAGGRVTLTVEAPREGAVRVSVGDSGAGITRELRDSVFHRWTEGSLGPREGTGLGLAIAADVARAHGGNLTASSSPDGGALFTLEIPVHRPA